MTEQLNTSNKDELKKRPVGHAIRKGLTRKCPQCGEGAMFDGYLKVKDKCENCGEDFSHQRADDGPAWATMLITGHLVPPVILGIYDHYENPNPLYVGIFLVVLFTSITLLLLPRVKGAFVGIQWANYMYGFNPNFVERKSERHMRQNPQ